MNVMTTYCITNGGGYCAGHFAEDVAANITVQQAGNTGVTTMETDTRCYENHAQDARYKDTGDCAPTCHAQMGTGGNNVPLVMGFNGGQSKDGGLGLGEDVSPSIRAQSSALDPSVAYVVGADLYNQQTTGDVAMSISAAASDAHHVPTVVKKVDPSVAYAVRTGHTAANGCGVSDCVAHTQDCAQPEATMHNATVRRLMPIETERLMGFPEVDVVEIGKMTKDEFIAWELASGNISVDASSGRVFSHRTGGGNPCEPRELEGTILNGYKVVSLREKNVKKQCRVHRIIWIAVNGIIPDGLVVDHINNIKTDNRIENLQLLSPSDNSHKAHEDGLYLEGEESPASKITNEERNEIVTLYNTGLISLQKLADLYGLGKSRVSQLVKRHGWTQIPWKGKPAEDCPDSPRYKACGNSFCVNCVEWIGRRIQENEEKYGR